MLYFGYTVVIRLYKSKELRTEDSKVASYVEFGSLNRVDCSDPDAPVDQLVRKPISETEIVPDEVDHLGLVNLPGELIFEMMRFILATTAIFENFVYSL